MRAVRSGALSPREGGDDRGNDEAAAAYGGHDVGRGPQPASLATAIRHDLRACAHATEHSATNAQVVTSSTDNGTGQLGTLSAAINFANANPGSTITFSGVTTVTLGASLPAITASTTIDGGNTVTIQAAGNQPFTINSGTVLLENMTVSGAKVLGGAGGTGNGGGGGGLAGGGAIYADAGSALTIKNVNFSNNQAIGGAGGRGDGSSADGGNGGNTNINSHGVLSGTGGQIGGPGNGVGNRPHHRLGRRGASGTTGGSGNGGGSGGAPGVGGNGGNGLGGTVFVSNNTTTTIAGGTTIDATNTATGRATGTGAQRTVPPDQAQAAVCMSALIPRRSSIRQRPTRRFPETS